MTYAVEVLIGEQWSRLHRTFPSRKIAEAIASSSRAAPIVKDARVIEVAVQR